jgi:hypothetical protein
MQASGSRESDRYMGATARDGSSRAAQPSLARSLVLNAVGLVALWFLYSAVRTVTADSFGAAQHNADRLIAFQDRLGLPSEAILQSSLLDYEWLLKGANVYYFAAHFPSMLLFLLWGLFLKRGAMPRVRWALIGSTAVGLVIHLAFPLAPPRMLNLAGFVDTARIFGPDPYALGIAKAANEFAAMPSMHVGWALLVAVAVVSLATSRWRWLVVLHPIVTTIVVVVTANHYWTDVVAGAVLVSLGWWLAGMVRPVPTIDAELDLLGGEVDLDLTNDTQDEIVLS